MGFMLFIISSLIKRILQPAMFLYGQIHSLCTGEWDNYNKTLAISIDQYGNGLCHYLFNWVLIKKSSTHRFGNIDETISSVIGKNKVMNTLTFFGKFLDIVLDLCEPNHSIKSIDKTKNY